MLGEFKVVIKDNKIKSQLGRMTGSRFQGNPGYTAASAELCTFVEVVRNNFQEGGILSFGPDGCSLNRCGDVVVWLPGDTVDVPEADGRVWEELIRTVSSVLEPGKQEPGRFLNSFTSAVVKQTQSKGQIYKTQL